MKIVWLTGESGAGKTTLARKLQEEWPCIILDGNEMRASISEGAGFSPEDRAEHNFRVARLAKELSKQTNVVVSVIAPLRNVRDSISEDMDVEWFYLKRKLPERKGHFYEESDEYPVIYMGELTIEESLDWLKSYLGIEKKTYSLFIGRWQPLHEGHLALFDKVHAEGKNIAIGIRDTERDTDNPLSAKERFEMIKHAVPDAEVFVMPDISEIVYGRKVGWGIREIRLDEETESISATKIRAENGNEAPNI